MVYQYGHDIISGAAGNGGNSMAAALELFIFVCDHINGRVSPDGGKTLMSGKPCERVPITTPPQDVCVNTAHVSRLKRSTFTHTNAKHTHAVSCMTDPTSAQSVGPGGNGGASPAAQSRSRLRCTTALMPSSVRRPGQRQRFPPHRRAPSSERAAAGARAPGHRDSRWS